MLKVREDGPRSLIVGRINNNDLIDALEVLLPRDALQGLADGQMRIVGRDDKGNSTQELPHIIKMLIVSLTIVIAG